MIVHINSNRQFLWALTMCVPFPFVPMHGGNFHLELHHHAEKIIFLHSFWQLERGKKFAACNAGSTWNETRAKKRRKSRTMSCLCNHHSLLPATILFSSVQVLWLMVVPPFFYMRNHGKLFGLQNVNFLFLRSGQAKGLHSTKICMVMNKKWVLWKGA